jgi:outer membrane immunogenic protein
MGHKMAARVGNSSKGFALASLALLCFAGTSSVRAEPANWTGFHLGAGGSFGMLDHQVDANFDDGTNSVKATFDGVGGRRVGPSVEVGFDYQLNANYVAGIEADTNFQGVNVLGRVGRLVDGSSLLYVVGGWSHDNFIDDIDGISSVVPYDTTTNGFTIGSGIETALSDHVTAKLEYRLTRYGDVTVFSDTDGLVTTSTQEQSIRGIISYHFGDVHPYRGEFNGRNWTGVHVGLGGGAGMIDHKIDLSGMGGSGIPDTFNGIGAKGFLGTAEAGFDYQVSDRFIVGLQGDYTLSNIKSSLSGSADIPAIPLAGSLEGHLQATDNFSILARAGVLSSPNVLWYGLGGWTHTTYDLGYSIRDNTNTVVASDSISQSADGLTFGVGFESMLAKNWSWKTEYRYTSLSKTDFAASFPISNSMQSVRSVLSYRF